MPSDTTEFLWKVQKGETESMAFPVVIGGQPLTVTGWAVDAQVKTNPGGPTLYTFPAEHIEITGDANDNITVRLPASVSTDWDFSVAWYRVRITDPDSPVDDPISYRVLQGTLLVDHD